MLRFAKALLALSLLLPLWACRDMLQPGTPYSRVDAAVDPGQQRVPDEYVVRLDSLAGVKRAQVEYVLSAHGGKLLRWWPHGYAGFHAKIPAAAVDVVQSTIGRILSIQPNLVHGVATAQPLFGIPGAWGLDRVNQHTWDHNATPPADWTYHYYYTGSTAHAYVIDSGVAPISGLGGRIGTGYSSVGGNPTAPCSPHGTEVASVIAADQPGVAKQVIVHPIQVTDCQGHWTTAS